MQPNVRGKLCSHAHASERVLIHPSRKIARGMTTASIAPTAATDATTTRVTSVRTCSIFCPSRSSESSIRWVKRSSTDDRSVPAWSSRFDSSKMSLRVATCSSASRNKSTMASACSSLKPPSRWSRRNASCVSMSVGISISEPFKKRCCPDTFVNGQVSEQAKSEARIQHRRRKSGTADLGQLIAEWLAERWRLVCRF